MMNEVKKIAFVVDGGIKIGLGHVYQSITFANLLKNKAEIYFMTKSDDIVINKIKEAGFAAHKFSSDLEILDYIEQNEPNIVIFDKIDTSAELAKNIKKNNKIILAIFTNLTNANRYADVAVTADIGSHFNNIKHFNSDTNTLYFYGPKYWILRKEFHDCNQLNKPRPESVDNILISFGGSDPANLTTLVTNELLGFNHDIRINIILGASFTHFESLERVLKEDAEKSKNVIIHRDVNNVANLMFNSDLVIASPGLSAFEALFVRTPILLFPQDQIQKETYQGFMKVIDKAEIDCLRDCIARMDFTYPDEEDIINMKIGQGSEEIINAILGNEADCLESTKEK
ncbi:MAG TPA: hypothetical protein VEF53_17715 [Patescibacteria group bacterium]|nr:hypothetical protein [Patescibacteria group bacterium]